MIDVLIRAPAYSDVRVALEPMYRLWGRDTVRPVLVLQTLPESEVIGGKIVMYSSKEYNYSLALNLGLAECSTDYVLICSSHSIVQFSREQLEAMLRLMDDEPSCAGICFRPGDGVKAEGIQRIDASSFDGFNGLNNSCSLIRLSVWQKLRFDETISAVEDQYWTRDALQKGYYLLRPDWYGYAYQNTRKLVFKKARDKLLVSRCLRKDMRCWRYLFRETLLALKNISAGNFSKAKERLIYVGLVAVDRVREVHLTSKY